MLRATAVCRAASNDAMKCLQSSFVVVRDGDLSKIMHAININTPPLGPSSSTRRGGGGGLKEVGGGRGERGHGGGRETGGGIEGPGGSHALPVCIDIKDLVMGIDTGADACAERGLRESTAGDEGWTGCEEAAETGGDLCWIYYTSGSTGPPKGVLCEHRCA